MTAKPRKPNKARKLERSRRLRDIRRGMKIAIYEVNQLLAPHGAEILFPKAFIPYTVALAEGNRRDASPEDRIAAALWQRAALLGLLRWR